MEPLAQRELSPHLCAFTEAAAHLGARRGWASLPGETLLSRADPSLSSKPEGQEPRVRSNLLQPRRVGMLLGRPRSLDPGSAHGQDRWSWEEGAGTRRWAGGRHGSCTPRLRSQEKARHFCQTSGPFPSSSPPHTPSSGTLPGRRGPQAESRAGGRESSGTCIGRQAPSQVQQSPGPARGLTPARRWLSQPHQDPPCVTQGVCKEPGCCVP